MPAPPGESICPEREVRHNARKITPCPPAGLVKSAQKVSSASVFSSHTFTAEYSTACPEPAAPQDSPERPRKREDLRGVMKLDSRFITNGKTPGSAGGIFTSRTQAWLVDGQHEIGVVGANSPLRSSSACRSGPLSVLGRSRESVSHVRVWSFHKLIRNAQVHLRRPVTALFAAQSASDHHGSKRERLNASGHVTGALLACDHKLLAGWRRKAEGHNQISIGGRPRHAFDRRRPANGGQFGVPNTKWTETWA